MDLLPLLISFAAGGLVAALGIFWIVARTALPTDGGHIEQLRRETDDAVPGEGDLVTRRGDQILH